MFSNLQLGSPNRSEQTFPCPACRRYEELITVTLDLQRQGQLGRIPSELNRWHDNLDAMGSPRTYSQSLPWQIDASSQAATRAFMYLSDEFEKVKRLLDINLFNRVSPEPVLKLIREAILQPVPMASVLMTYLQSHECIFAEALESQLEALEALADFLRGAFHVQTHILLELVVRAKSHPPQDPQETVRTFRELHCILNNEDASHLREAVTSLIGL
jgi:hypothetical protein